MAVVLRPVQRSYWIWASGIFQGAPCTTHPQKKFKGALDLLLQKQRNEQAEAEQGDERDETEPLQASEPTTTTSPPPPKAASPPPLATPPAAPPPPKAASAATAAAPPPPAGGASSAQAGASTPSLAKESNFAFKFESNTLRALNTTDRNTKVPPLTPVMVVLQGHLREIVSAGATDIQFTGITPKTIVILSDTMKHIALSKLISEQKANSLYQHASWPVGTAPVSFTRKKTAALQVPADAIAIAAAAPQSVVWVWIVQVQGSKIVPAGIALCIKKQLNLKKGAEEPLP